VCVLWVETNAAIYQKICAHKYFIYASMKHDLLLRMWGWSVSFYDDVHVRVQCQQHNEVVQCYSPHLRCLTKGFSRSWRARKTSLTPTAPGSPAARQNLRKKKVACDRDWADIEKLESKGKQILSWKSGKYLQRGNGSNELSELIWEKGSDSRVMCQRSKGR